MVSVLSHRFHICLQMHDIVKAVGNCSYNQLVEKIISCKQSDSSELAGEGECCFLIAPPSSPLLRFLIMLSLHGRCLPNHTCWNKTGTFTRFLIKWPASAARRPHCQLWVKIFAHSTLSFLSRRLSGWCQADASRPLSMIKLVWEIHFHCVPLAQKCTSEWFKEIHLQQLETDRSTEIKTSLCEWINF